MNEHNPTSRIVDAETFGYYLVGLRAGILADPQVRRTAARRLIHEHAPDADPHYFITIEGIPYSKVSQSLQKVISEQYEAASLEEEKMRFGGLKL